MIKQFSRFLTICAVASFIGGASAQDNAKIKIATVDMQELFKKYYKTNEAQIQINVERTRLGKENNERLQRIREIEEALVNLKKQFDDPSTSDSKKASIDQEAKGLQTEGSALDRERREFVQRRTQALTENSNQRTRSILDEIRKMVEEQAKADNYDYVFDKSGMSITQVPFLLYTKDATDITATLLKTLNKDAPADAGEAKDPIAPIDPSAPVGP